MADQTYSDTPAPRGLAVVTGASAGIGMATAVALRKAGFLVIAAARRLDEGSRHEVVQDGIVPVHLDVTDDGSVAALARTVAATGVPLTLLVNNAGVALGADLIVESDLTHWQRMYDVNVFGVLRVTKALLPQLIENGGHVVVLGSTVGHVAYERGGGYASSKHAVSAFASTLRLELSGTPVRVTELAPGMVRSEEFMVNRFLGDSDAAAAVYRGVDEPLSPEDIAECVAWCVTRPPHVDVDLLMVRPVAQAAQHKVHRTEPGAGSRIPR
ncbi:SDR family NAD(P)-dependent oxidoreductase [Kitasatospora viridis]|uniref:NADP-dependent 3-hydroxy acid dehydrogenase YdfG n=1 Tax=Kitasatospora viridis TaxID=281105 RepID=A0A561SDT7_9ACTN|nr:SDR family NAD(P)-dependent oxidoreductase [Kitasatospora viridis]TWF73036.1 NADP-dependent 3-hydroxy acid dehydrogenase YdfG [Kitasatospora viridis]